MAHVAEMLEYQMPRWTRTVNVIAVGFCLAVCTFGVISILGFDYSDREIESSLVDTWEVAALRSCLLLSGVMVVAVTGFVFAKGHSGVRRGKLRFTAWLAVAAFVLQFIGMLVLTRRAELLEDSNLNGLFYFF